MKCVIFDFDGTIADSLTMFIEGGKELADIQVTKQQVESYRNMTVMQVLKEIDIPKRKIPKYAMLGRTYLREHIDKMEIIKGIGPVIKDLHEQNITMRIVSSNNADSISIFLDKYKLKQYFETIHGGISVFGKTNALKKIIKQYKIDKNQSLYVGDEVRDIKAAHKVGLKIVSVTWGFNGKKIIQKNKPDGMADRPDQLLKAILNNL